MLRPAIISVVLVLAAGVTALFFFGRSHTYAVTELNKAPLHLRIVDGPLDSDADCASRLRSVANALVRTCPQCKPVQSCPGSVDEELTAALDDQKMSAPYVRAGTMREIIKAPQPTASQVCRAIVQTMAAQGNPAECIEP
ncbi:MAG TPA: hypothetical protein VL574_02165 [Stellaceae bacterium]|jgi:hypothetical protein|nr:hypothetical protein [Stellaceae bacterium]